MCELGILVRKIWKVSGEMEGSRIDKTHRSCFSLVTGQTYCSMKPTVFSFSPDPQDKRHFMRISTSAHKPVQFHAPGEGGILGMGANAIVHRVDLGKVVKSANSREPGFMENCPQDDRWDAAVKRLFSFDKMVAFLQSRSEAGLAKRIRMASSLNSDGRVVEFYGLGCKHRILSSGDASTLTSDL
jgi:hypothetical protein